MISITAKDESFRKEVQEGNIWKVVFKVCLPLALYSWMSMLFAVLDTLMASSISSDAVSTVVYMVQLQHIVLAIGGGLSVGGGILIAHAYGSGDGERIRTILSTTVTLCMTLSALILLILPFTPMILRLAGTPEVFISLGSTYFVITLLGIIHIERALPWKKQENTLFKSCHSHHQTASHSTVRIRNERKHRLHRSCITDQLSRPVPLRTLFTAEKG